jgi:hypothetical protein
MISEKSISEIKQRQEDEAWDNELKKLGRYDLASNHKTTPEHYSGGGIEPIKFIQSHNLDFCSGNIIKYVVRHKFKGQPVEDLNKARHYIDLLLTEYEK